MYRTTFLRQVTEKLSKEELEYWLDSRLLTPREQKIVSDEWSKRVINQVA
jgi:hypothetical protein